MEIKVLGPGCAKCKAAYKVVEKVVTESMPEAQLTKVEDIVERVVALAEGDSAPAGKE